MSTKIYGGFAVAPWNASLPALHALVQDLRAQIKPLAQRAAAKVIFESAVNELDRRAIGIKPREEKSSPLSYAWLHYNDEQRKINTTGQRNPRYDLEFTLSLMPHPDGRVLGIAHTEHDDWSQLWLQQPGVSDYHYFDNCDRPHGISEAAWDKRRMDWDLVLGWNAPRDCGFSVTIHPNETRRPPRSEDLLAELMPTLETRARVLAVDRVLFGLGLKEMHNLIEALHQTQPGGKLAGDVERAVAEILPLLDPNPTFATLAT